jgi:signal transduction histidine kinase
VRALALLPRPLDVVRSIKLKLGIVVVTSGAVGLAIIGIGIGWLPVYTSAIAIAVALVTSQLLANGMTKPVRDMTAAVRAMARGDYSLRVRATSRDEVGQLAEAFNQMAADLEAADRQRRELIANVAHELRTPITALQAVLENVVDGVSDPDTLATALAQTERLGRLVSELLDLSRIDAGAHRLDLQEFDVTEFLQAVARESQVNANAAGRDVTFVASSEPLTAVADPGRLHQVVANLLDNAARHSPVGGSVTATAARDADGALIIEVTDEGNGIPARQRERVFERFTRGARPATGGGGTGLGLAIAHWVVELHGGTIAIVDPPPNGTDLPGCRIRVSLPA